MLNGLTHTQTNAKKPGWGLITKGWGLIAKETVLGTKFRKKCRRFYLLSKYTHITRGPWILALCLQTAVGMTNCIFCRLHLCQKLTVAGRPKQLKFFNSHRVSHHACIHFRLFQHLNFDFSRSLKVKCDSVIRCPMYDFLLMSNGYIWPNSAPLQDISLCNMIDLDIDLSRSLSQV